MYKNKESFYKNSKTSKVWFRRLLKAFAMSFSTSDTAGLTGISVKSVNMICLKTRVRVVEYCETQPPHSGEVELDKPYFGLKRIRAKRGPETGSKTIVFGTFNTIDMSIQKLSQMLKSTRYYR